MGDSNSGLMTEISEDWLPVKDEIFKEKKVAVKLIFSVIWNFEHKKFAVTCRAHSRTHTTTEEEAWTCLLSSFQLNCIHTQLRAIVPSFIITLPLLPYEPQGIWCLIYDADDADEHMCRQIERYLQLAVDMCGQKIFLAVFFEEMNSDDYYDNMNKWQLKECEEKVANLSDKLVDMQALSDKDYVNLLERCSYYQLEDAAFSDWCLALTKLYNMKLHPFLDLREISNENIRHCKSQLENEALGPRPKAEFSASLSKWVTRYSETQAMILELHTEFFVKIKGKIKELIKRMKIDEGCFGSTSFNKYARPRLNRLEEEMLKTEVQSFRCELKSTELEETKIKKQMSEVPAGSDNASRQLDVMENSVYKTRMKAMEYKVQILENETKIARLTQDVKRQQLKEIEEEDEFHDAVDNLNLAATVESRKAKLKAKVREEIEGLNKKVSSLSKKKAQLRNKLMDMEQCHQQSLEEKDKKQQDYKKHHSIQKKRDDQAAEEAAKKSFYDKEKQKALKRIREHKQKTKSLCKKNMDASLYDGQLGEDRSDPSPDTKTGLTPVQAHENKLDSTPTLASSLTSYRGYTNLQAGGPPPPPPPPSAGPPPPPPPPPPPSGGPPPPPPPPIIPSELKLNGRPPMQSALSSVSLKSAQPSDKSSKTDVVEDLFMKIREGVKLKPVTSSNESERKPVINDGQQQELDFNAALQARFKRMNIHVSDETSGSDEDADIDW